MKKLLIVIVATAFVVDAGWHAINSLLHSIDVSTAGVRMLADARILATALESYKAAHGVYPVAKSVEELSSALTPSYVKQLPAGPLRYFSDGHGYTSFIWPMGNGAYSALPNGLGPLEVRDGVLVSWPKELNIGGGTRLADTGGGVQPNSALQRPHSRVTSRA